MEYVEYDNLKRCKRCKRYPYIYIERLSYESNCLGILTLRCDCSGKYMIPNTSSGVPLMEYEHKILAYDSTELKSAIEQWNEIN